MVLAGTIPAESGVQVDTVTVVDGVVVVVVRATRQAVPCPACGQLAGRVHSRYRRTLTDLPWQGVAVRLELHARRFRCDEPTCARCIFTERFPGLVAVGARRSARLSTLYVQRHCKGLSRKVGAGGTAPVILPRSPARARRAARRGGRRCVPPPSCPTPTHCTWRNSSPTWMRSPSS